jgi:hypothetical protein
MELERASRQLAELGIVQAIVSVLVQPCHCTSELCSSEMRFQTAWLAYQWGRAVTAGVLPAIAPAHAERWALRLQALSASLLAGPHSGCNNAREDDLGGGGWEPDCGSSTKFASQARQLCELQAGVQELSRLGVECKLWQARACI